MPILLKKIEAEIISLFGDTLGGASDFTAPVYLLQSVVGNAGIEDYIELTTFTALTQDFSSVGSSNFNTPPLQYGLDKCTNYVGLNLTYNDNEITDSSIE